VSTHTNSFTGKELEGNTARELAVLPGVLHLNYCSITLSAAQALASSSAETIEFTELPLMNDACVSLVLEMAEHVKLSIGRIWGASEYLGRMERMNLILLSRYAESVNLEGISDLSHQEADVLSAFQGHQLLLHLDRLDEVTAAHLSRVRTELLMLEVPRLCDDAATALSRSLASEELQISVSEDSVSVKAADELSQYGGHALSIELGIEPSPDILRMLAQFTGHLRITVPRLTAEAAMAVGNSNGTLELHCETPTPDIRQILLNSKREITNLDELTG